MPRTFDPRHDPPPMGRRSLLVSLALALASIAAGWLLHMLGVGLD